LDSSPERDANKRKEHNLDLNNIKDDIVMIQFKLVRKDTLKTQNTFSFVNMPASKSADINIVTLSEIVQKQNVNSLKNRRANREQFLPYNKSILTRILFPQLSKQNILVVNHYSKRAISKYLKVPPSNGYSAGPAKGLFNSILKLGYSEFNRMLKKKVSQQ